MSNNTSNSNPISLPPVAKSRPSDVVIERNSIKPNNLVIKTLD